MTLMASALILLLCAAAPPAQALQVGQTENRTMLVYQDNLLLASKSLAVHSGWLKQTGFPTSWFSNAIDSLKEAIGKFEKDVPWNWWLWVGITAWTIWTALSALVAGCCYGQFAQGADMRARKYPTDVLQYGHFNCLRGGEICICGLLCPAIRWADTIQMTGFMSFWGAFTLFVILVLLNFLTMGPYVFGIFTALGMLYCRQYIRKTMHMPFCTARTCCLDGWFLLLCPLCAIVQEARTVHSSQEGGSGYVRQLPSVLARAAYSSPPPPIGAPVAVMAPTQQITLDAVCPNCNAMNRVACHALPTGWPDFQPVICFECKGTFQVQPAEALIRPAQSVFVA